MQTRRPLPNHFRVWVMLFVENFTVTVKCRTASNRNAVPLL
jgi:hypothetical protein